MLTDRSRLRLVVLGALVISLVVTLLARLWYLQVLAAPTYKQEALDNQIRTVVTEAPRGEILDDTGQPLVENKSALVVSVNRSTILAMPDEGSAVLHRLAKKLHISYSLIEHKIQLCGTKVNGKIIGQPCWQGSSFQPIPVSQLSTSDAAKTTALQIEEEHSQFPGISVQLSPVRSYPTPYGALASAVLGYIQPITEDQLKKLTPTQQTIQRSTDVGATGLEASYEKYLHGTPGLKQVTVNHVEAVTGTVKDTSPVPGDDVVTNIDAKAQSDLETQLQKALDSARRSGYSGDFAAGVIMNARTGGVVAMASNPTYDPSNPPPTLSAAKYKQLLHAPGTPLFDKAFQSAEPPGSTFKMISSAGLIKDGSISPGALYACPTLFTADNQTRHSFEGEAGLGNIPLSTAIEQSCDTFFFELGYKDWNRDTALIKQGKKPREGVQNMARDLGLGANPDIDLPNATYGHIPDRYNTKKDWEQLKSAYCQGAKNKSFSATHRADDLDYCKYGGIFLPGDQENVDVGQGTVTASPLQMAVAYSALANGGTVFEPRVAKAIVSPAGKVIKKIEAPVRGHIPLSKADLAYLKSCFYTVTEQAKGTAYGAFHGFPMSQVEVGGKTGTAELPNTQQNDSWFVSFGGPTGEKPQFVTVIEVYKSNQGAISAAPFVRNIWDDLYGFGGAKAIFPNGVPPSRLPPVNSRGNVPVKHKPTPSKSTSPSTSPTASSGTTTAALGGVPDVVESRRVSTSGGSP